MEDWTAIWAEGRLPQPELLFCPSMRQRAHQYDTPENPWLPGTVRTGYSRRFLPTNAGGLTHLSQIGQSQALAADLVVSPDRLKYQHQTGVNVLYLGGEVEFRKDVASLFEAAGVKGGSTGSNDQLDAVWTGLDH
jgi:hypothetical protein